MKSSNNFLDSVNSFIIMLGPEKVMGVPKRVFPKIDVMTPRIVEYGKDGRPTYPAMQLNNEDFSSKILAPPTLNQGKR